MAGNFEVELLVQKTIQTPFKFPQWKTGPTSVLEMW